MKFKKTKVKPTQLRMFMPSLEYSRGSTEFSIKSLSYDIGHYNRPTASEFT